MVLSTAHLLPQSLSKSTPGVARAWDAAVRIAFAEGSALIHTAHVLCGLLEEGEGRPVLLLTEAGMDIESWRALQPKGLKSPALSQAAAPVWSRLVDQSIQEARELSANWSADRVIETEHLLLALVKTDDELRANLQSHKLDYARLEAKMSALHKPLTLDEPLVLAEPAEQAAAARIIDAAENRAREALRVIEDYCRFVLSDRALTEESKKLRHELRHAISEIDLQHRLEARDTTGDVGTTAEAPTEYERRSPHEVVGVSFRRLQESLRSLEEFGKLRGAQVGRAVERLRYRTYVLEQPIVQGASKRSRLEAAQLYLIATPSECSAALDWTITEAVGGGVQMVQLRDKERDDRELLQRARLARRLTRERGVLLIINDRPDIAHLVQADGVHLGQTDMTVHDARRILGHGSLVGVSTHDLAQVRQAVVDGADYIGVGPAFLSSTKSFEHLAGIDFVAEALEETSLPAFAIGGINLDNAGRLFEQGARRFAVCSAICRAIDPRALAQSFRAILDVSGGRRTDSK
jgi:thiamine-phosphate pyrophosphorylase